MRKVKTIAARITVDFLLYALAVLAALALYRAMTWCASCEGRETGSNYPNAMSEAAIGTLPRYRKLRPSYPATFGK